jgi:hypothetical protein
MLTLKAITNRQKVGYRYTKIVTLANFGFDLILADTHYLEYHISESSDHIENAEPIDRRLCILTTWSRSIIYDFAAAFCRTILFLC